MDVQLLQLIILPEQAERQRTGFRKQDEQECMAGSENG
jgi:hypothetical protein